MLENNKVDADTGKKLSPESEQSEAFTTFVKRVRTVVRTRQWLRFPDIFVPEWMQILIFRLKILKERKKRS